MVVEGSEAARTYWRSRCHRHRPAHDNHPPHVLSQLQFELESSLLAHLVSTPAEAASVVRSMRFAFEDEQFIDFATCLQYLCHRGNLVPDVCVVAAPTVCYDRHQRCVVWARQGMCESGPHAGYMSSYCRMSCNQCNMGQQGFCHNHDMDCNDYYDRGWCRSQREFMEATCPQICGFCCLLRCVVKRVVSRVLQRRGTGTSCSERWFVGYET